MGTENFIWVEDYFLSSESKKEFKKLKKNLPSLIDTFKFFSFEEIDQGKGILVNIQ